MASAESNLAENYYSFIKKFSSKQWWEFIRILGLPETDIDELFYDSNDLTEQKYQMLSRWKSYYGYKKRDDEVIECLDLAWREVMGNVSPQLLNQKLQGSLQENRYIAKKFYEVMRNIHKEQRNHFVKTKLKVSDTEIASIMADYSNDVDEQCFQMFMTWKRKSMLQRYAEISNEIEKLLDEFLDRNGGPNEARGGPERHQQVSSDTGRGGRSFQHNELHQQPSGPG